MATNMAKNKQNETLLFKPDLKFMDFHHQTFSYLNTIKLNEKSKTGLAIRIHDYVFPMQEAILMYSHNKIKQVPKTYQVIESGLKETLRRVKISLALNNNQSKLFIGYWKFLVNVFRMDAIQLKDEQLQMIIDGFEKNVSLLKVKKV